MQLRTRLNAAVGLAMLLAALPLLAQSPAAAGRWQAKEDGTVSVIELYLRDGQLFGRVVSKVDAQGRPLRQTCNRCPAPWQGKPLEEIEFLYGLREDAGQWTGGKVIDLRDGPTQGVAAHAEISIDGDVLVLHAYLGLRVLGQTRRWTRLPDAAAADRP